VRFALLDETVKVAIDRGGLIEAALCTRGDLMSNGGCVALESFEYLCQLTSLRLRAPVHRLLEFGYGGRIERQWMRQYQVGSRCQVVFGYVSSQRQVRPRCPIVDH